MYSDSHAHDAVHVILMRGAITSFFYTTNATTRSDEGMIVAQIRDSMITSCKPLLPHTHTKSPEEQMVIGKKGTTKKAKKKKQEEEKQAKIPCLLTVNPFDAMERLRDLLFLLLLCFFFWLLEKLNQRNISIHSFRILF